MTRGRDSVPTVTLVPGQEHTVLSRENLHM